eukprot:515585_1
MIVIFFGIIVVVQVVFTEYLPPLWPLPREFTNGTSTIELCSNFPFKTNVDSTILNEAIARFDTNLNDNIVGDNCDGIINIESSDESLTLNTNVSYTISIELNIITINSNTIYGAIYALTTLQQFIDTNKIINNVYNTINNVPWFISDYPQYNYRGLLIDTSRSYLSISTIYTILDGMSYNKLNALHWHIIDSHSFPFYSKSNPNLALNGAYSLSEIYYPNNITDVINYALYRGIRVIPEFDTPGHVFSMSYGAPDVVICDTINDQTSSMCPEPPCGYLNVENISSHQLVENIYNDAFNIFTDKYFHLGADEVESCWGSNTTALFRQWITFFANYVDKANKTPILWSSNTARFSQIGQHNFEIIMEIWDNANDKLVSLINGFKIIDANEDYYYLDCGFGDWLYPTQVSWCTPYRNWGMIYNYSITEGIPLQYHNNIYGGEVCMWGEEVDESNIQQRIWPRAAAAAERWWRDDYLTQNNINNVIYRLALQRDRMLNYGISSTPVQPKFCTLNPEYCNYFRNGQIDKNYKMKKNDWKTLMIQNDFQQFIDIFMDDGWIYIKEW